MDTRLAFAFFIYATPIISRYLSWVYPGTRYISIQRNISFLYHPPSPQAAGTSSRPPRATHSRCLYLLSIHTQECCYCGHEYQQSHCFISLVFYLILPVCPFIVLPAGRTFYTPQQPALSCELPRVPESIEPKIMALSASFRSNFCLASSLPSLRSTGTGLNFSAVGCTPVPRIFCLVDLDKEQSGIIHERLIGGYLYVLWSCRCAVPMVPQTCPVMDTKTLASRTLCSVNAPIQTYGGCCDNTTDISSTQKSTQLFRSHGPRRLWLRLRLRNTSSTSSLKTHNVELTILIPRRFITEAETKSRTITNRSFITIGWRKEDYC
ncbi:hypothetical protein BGX38DRAFT_1189400 [Terfezia claveryi]|nr:hypothetical protein BGX38DRAFT_1189400 [Terfezia claveryi]